MGALVFGIVVAAFAFAAGLLGLNLRVRLPEKHAPDKSRDMIGAMTGMLSLLLALVLGTLIGNAYALYATQKSELETLAARTLQLDAALEAYGPEGQPGRDALRKAITQSYERVWGEAQTEKGYLDLKSAMTGGKLLQEFLMSLSPKTDAQKQALGAANAAAGQIVQNRVMMQLQLLSGISWQLLAIVVCWSLLLFLGYGLVSPMNATVVVALALGAVAVASAVLLIIELSQPYSGIFKISPAPILETIQALSP